MGYPHQVPECTCWGSNPDRQVFIRHSAEPIRVHVQREGQGRTGSGRLGESLGGHATKRRSSNDLKVSPGIRAVPRPSDSAHAL